MFMMNFSAADLASDAFSFFFFLLFLLPKKLFRPGEDGGGGLGGGAAGGGGGPAFWRGCLSLHSTHPHCLHTSLSGFTVPLPLLSFVFGALRLLAAQFITQDKFDDTLNLPHDTPLHIFRGKNRLAFARHHNLLCERHSLRTGGHQNRYVLYSN
jgi:hypothetical protein